jgi:hypothetical protein
MAKAKYKLGLALAAVLSMAMTASGQGRGFSPPVRGPSGPARGLPGSVRGIAPQRGSLGSAPSGLRPGFVSPLVGTPLNPNFAPIRGVPGLGFDFQHLAAIERPFRDRFGRRHRGLFFTPLFFDALPISYPYDTEYPYESGIPDYYTGAAQEPQFVIPPQQAPAETTPRATEPQTPAPPPPELGQLILVRRDGRVLLAVAFTTNRGQLTYITQEGTRRSFPLSELDKDATRQMNDANGTSVSLPE